MSGSLRECLGVSRLRGLTEMAVWISLAAIVAVLIAGRDGSVEGLVLAGLMMAALSHYAIRSFRAIRGGGRLVADGSRRAFYRHGRHLVHFDDICALHSRMVNSTCAEFRLDAERDDGEWVMLYEGKATNAAYRTIERMASLAGVPFHHRLQ